MGNWYKLPPLVWVCRSFTFYFINTLQRLHSVIISNVVLCHSIRTTTITQESRHDIMTLSRDSLFFVLITWLCDVMQHTTALTIKTIMFQWPQQLVRTANATWESTLLHHSIMLITMFSVFFWSIALLIFNLLNLNVQFKSKF